MSDGRKCDVCGEEVVREPGQKGRLPKIHPKCEGKRDRPARATQRRRHHEKGEFTAHDIVDRFGLNYNLGNTVRYVLERDEGDELENLQNAKVYLDREVERLEGAVRE